MSAIPKEFIQTAARLSEEVTRPYPGSRKIYLQGSRPDVRVGMREVQQQDTSASFGLEKNPPVTIYDTSGPYTDPDASIDLRKGLLPLRAAWIAERGDTEQHIGYFLLANGLSLPFRSKYEVPILFWKWHKTWFEAE